MATPESTTLIALSAKYTRQGTSIKSFEYPLPTPSTVSNTTISPIATTTKEIQLKSKNSLKALTNALIVLQKDLNEYLTAEMEASGIEESEVFEEEEKEEEDFQFKSD
ncbi:hypothetical protein G9A89_011751 [Geosiphon pyriformis]|nr:hypothetical protein G9A89_011751 [Geosiphon pyriformis]